MSKTTKNKATKKPGIRVTNGEQETPATTVDATSKKTRKRQDGKMSGLDAAAKVLADAGQPLNAKEMLERIQAADLWETNGKTPQATLYAAIIREIDLKGKASRFVKTERGHFTIA